MDAAVQEAITIGMREQLARLERALSAGMPRVGWKVAFTDPRAMARFGIDWPLVAWLDGHAVLEPGVSVTLPEGSRVLLEAEVAVRMGPDGTVAAMGPAFELVDFSRPATGLDVILPHSVFHHATVLGPLLPPIAWPPEGWPIVSVHGAERARLGEGLAAPDLGALLEHVGAYLGRAGAELREGDLVITGSLIDPVLLTSGDQVSASFGPLGTITVAVA